MSLDSLTPGKIPQCLQSTVFFFFFFYIIAHFIWNYYRDPNEHGAYQDGKSNSGLIFWEPYSLTEQRYLSLGKCTLWSYHMLLGYICYHTYHLNDWMAVFLEGKNNSQITYKRSWPSGDPTLFSFREPTGNPKAIKTPSSVVVAIV